MDKINCIRVENFCYGNEREKTHYPFNKEFAPKQWERHSQKDRQDEKTEGYVPDEETR